MAVTITGTVNAESERANNLRAISEKSTKGVPGQALFHWTPTDATLGGLLKREFRPNTDILSPQETAVVQTIAKKLKLKTPNTPKAPLTVKSATPEQWKRIVGQAQARLADIPKTQGGKGAKEGGKSTVSADEKAIATSPWTKASDALAQTLTNQVANIATAQRGTTATKETQTAINQGLADVGGAGGTVTPGASAWLSQNTAAEEKANAPLAAAETAYANTFIKSAVPVEQAIQQGGAANAEAIATAPYATLVKALGSHTLYQTVYEGGALPGGQTLPQWLQYYGKLAGVPLSSAAATPALPAVGQASSPSTQAPQAPQAPGNPSNPAGS